MPEQFANRVHDDLAALTQAVAAINVNVATLLTNQQHVMANQAEAKEAMKGYVPRVEIEQTHAGMKSRLDKVEANQRQAAWAIISAWLAGAGAVLTGALKFKGG